MAKSRDNVVMQGASGKVGRNLVFRQRGDQTIIAKRPRVTAGGREVTEKQQQVQNRFLNASLYAKQAIQDPELKAAYSRKATVNQTAYNVAFKDFFARPEVRLLNDSGYLGNVGDEITFLVRDILKVTAIEFEILDQDDTVVEVGQAEPTDEENTGWKYTASTENIDYTNAIYRITMLDTPKNTTEVMKAYGEDRDVNP